MSFILLALLSKETSSLVFIYAKLAFGNLTKYYPMNSLFCSCIYVLNYMSCIDGIQKAVGVKNGNSHRSYIPKYKVLLWVGGGFLGSQVGRYSPSNIPSKLAWIRIPKLLYTKQLACGKAITAGK